MRLRLRRMTPVLTPISSGTRGQTRRATGGTARSTDPEGQMGMRRNTPVLSRHVRPGNVFQARGNCRHGKQFPGGGRLRQQSFGWRDAILRKSYTTGSGIGGRCRIMPPRETVPKSPQQDIVFAALLAAIEKSAEPWASTEEVAAAGGLTLRQTRRSLRRLRVHGRASMVYPATRGRYWAPWDDIIRLDLQLRAWKRNK